MKTNHFFAPRHGPVWVALALGLSICGVAQAQFAQVPQTATKTAPRSSQAEIEKEYRIDAARHLYAAYPKRIYKGKLPPLLFSVMIVETDIDATGQVGAVRVVRPPAAPEVEPWVLAMIKGAAPFPAPARMRGVRYLDIWLVDKSGQFQVDTLTEGQR